VQYVASARHQHRLSLPKPARAAVARNFLELKLVGKFAGVKKKRKEKLRRQQNTPCIK
jgi:hypothetical protein